MKTNYEVAQAFVRGCSAETRNMYSVGDAVYSYGPHFEIARHINGRTFLTMRSWGPTTAKHICMVRRALMGDYYLVPDPAKSVEWNMKEYARMEKELLERVRRARKNGDRYMAEYEKLVYDRKVYEDTVQTYNILG